MTLNFYNLIFMFFFMGFLSFCINRFHLLMILLSLEFMVLFMYMIIIMYLNMFEMELFFSMIFLTLTVCEGVLGLSILIMMVRMHGNDYYQILSIL